MQSDYPCLLFIIIYVMISKDYACSGYTCRILFMVRPEIVVFSKKYIRVISLEVCVCGSDNWDKVLYLLSVEDLGTVGTGLRFNYRQLFILNYRFIDVNKAPAKVSLRYSLKKVVTCILWSTNSHNFCFQGFVSSPKSRKAANYLK